MQYNDGSSYEGEQFNNLRDGYGKLIFKDGAYYEGGWHEDRMNGKGCLYYSSGELAYEG